MKEPITVLRAVPGFLALSETFIDTGARALAPDVRTVFLADEVLPQARSFPGHRVETLPRPWYARLPGLRRRRERTAFLESMKNRHGAHLLHAHFGHHARRWVSAARAAGLPLVVSLHGYDVSAYPRRRPQAYRRLFAEAALVLASSDDLRRRALALGCPESKVRTFVVGIEPDRFPFAERRPDGPLRVLAVGRHVPKKGFGLLAEAARRLAAEGMEIELLILGPGPGPALPLAAPARWVDALRAADPFAARAEALARAHVAAVPSTQAPDGDAEGTPNVLLEFQAAGLPVLATRHGGIPQAVDVRSAVLVEPGSAEALAQGLRELWRRREAWPAMGRAGRTLVEERFDARRQAGTMAAWYEEVCCGTKVR